MKSCVGALLAADGAGSHQVCSFLAGAAGYEPAPFDLAANDVLREAAAQV